jgi:hypothetical protein
MRLLGRTADQTLWAIRNVGREMSNGDANRA